MTTFTIDRKDLLEKLDIVAPGLAPRDIVEQSSCAVFTEGRLITFNDEIACQIPCDIPFEGAIPASTLIQTLKTLATDSIEVEVSDNEIILKSKKRRVGIVREPNVLLPYKEKLELPEKWKSLPDEFSDGVEMLLPCCGKDEQNFQLTCVHLRRKFAEATDNLQYARFKMELPLDENVLVRSGSMKHVVPMGVTKISVTDAWVHFRNARKLVISCRRWKETYADYSDYIKTEGTHMSFPRMLGKSAELASVFSSQNTDSNFVNVTVSNGRMKIESRGTSGWSEQIVKVAYSGPDAKFAIDPGLLKRISQMSSECILSEKTIRVKSGKFTYMSCLSK